MQIKYSDILFIQLYIIHSMTLLRQIFKILFIINIVEWFSIIQSYAYITTKLLFEANQVR